MHNSLNYLAESAKLLLRGRRHKFGYAVLNVGTPISAKAYAKEHNIAFNTLPKAERIEHAKALAATLMEGIGAIVPVLPVGVVARVFVNAGVDGRVSAETLHTQSTQLITQLQAQNVRVYFEHDEKLGIEDGLHILTLRQIVQEKHGYYHVAPDQWILLNYYANSIAHFFEQGNAINK